MVVLQVGRPIRLKYLPYLEKILGNEETHATINKIVDQHIQ